MIHLQGTLEGTQPPQGYTFNNPVDYFAFGVLAGQSMTVSVTPRFDPNFTSSEMSPIMLFAVYDPDGNQVAVSDNFYSYQYAGQNLNYDGSNVNRPITFTADRPGVYRVAVSNVTNNTAH